MQLYWRKTHHLGRAAPAIVVALAACAAPFSELQSARLAGRGRAEITGAYSHVDAARDGETAKIQDVFAVHAATGLTQTIDLRVRLDHIRVADDDGVDVSATALGVGPKFSIIPDRLAFSAPLGFAFGSGIEQAETWQFHPSVIWTLPIAQTLEFNSSLKALIPLTGDDDGVNEDSRDVLAAINVGLAWSPDLARWAVRPEIGFLQNPGNSGAGTLRHFSIGFTYYLSFAGQSAPPASQGIRYSP